MYIIKHVTSDRYFRIPIKEREDKCVNRVWYKKQKKATRWSTKAEAKDYLTTEYPYLECNVRFLKLKSIPYVIINDFDAGIRYLCDYTDTYGYSHSAADFVAKTGFVTHCWTANLDLAIEFASRQEALEVIEEAELP